VIALDTNVLVRAIVAEADADATTRAQQQRAMALLSSGKRLFIPLTVAQEVEWVLRSIYGMPVQDIAAVLQDLLHTENIETDRAAAVQQALAGYTNGLDFSDALHLALAGLCTGMASFDTRFAKRAGRLGLKPSVAAPAG
jgi:predicted nucleic-acid-binding protein